MTIVRFDPPKRGKTGVRAFASMVGAFIADPLMTAVTGLATGAVNDATDWYPFAVPVEVDTETGQVRLDTASAYVPQFWAVGGKGGQGKKMQQARDARAAAALPMLQAAYDSGQVAPGLPPEYSLFASQIAQLRHDSPNSPPGETITEGAQYTGDRQMGGIVPPGGFAGFAQMTPASKAAQGMGGLLKSAKRYARGTRKRRKKKASGTKRKRKASGSRRKKLVKGSAAAKRFMANLRRKRK